VELEDPEVVGLVEIIPLLLLQQMEFREQPTLAVVEVGLAITPLLLHQRVVMGVPVSSSFVT
jgi:hypothetical protein